MLYCLLPSAGRALDLGVFSLWFRPSTFIMEQNDQQLQNRADAYDAALDSYKAALSYYEEKLEHLLSLVSCEEGDLTHAQLLVRAARLTMKARALKLARASLALEREMGVDQAVAEAGGTGPVVHLD